MIERNLAEALEFNAESVAEITAVADDVGVRWVYSFLSADQRKTYCLYEAESEEALLEAARRSNVPADVIVRVDRIDPTKFAASSEPSDPAEDLNVGA